MSIVPKEITLKPIRNKFDIPSTSVRHFRILPFFRLLVATCIWLIIKASRSGYRAPSTTRTYSSNNLRNNFEMEKMFEQKQFLNTEGRKLIIIRHGSTEMNEALASQPWGTKHFKDQLLWDTILSPKGTSQAQKLNQRLKQMLLPDEIELIIASPLTRTLQTAELCLEGFPTEIPRIVLPLARERLYLSSDVGVSKSILVEKFSSWNYAEIRDDDEPWWFTVKDSTYSIPISESSGVSSISSCKLF